MAGKHVDDHLARPYRVEITRSGDGYFARVPELPGCMTWTTDRHDFDQLEAMVEDANLATWIADVLEDGDPVPEPAGSAEDGFEVTGRLLGHRKPQTVGWRAGVLHGDGHALYVADLEARLADGGWIGGCGRPIIFRLPGSMRDPFDVMMLLTRDGIFEVVERVAGVVPRRRKLPRGVLPL